MRVLCIHVYGTRVSPTNAPITVQVGCVYTAVKEGTKSNGFRYYELIHQPGVAYDRNCFVPLDPALDDVEEDQSEKSLTMTTLQRTIMTCLFKGMYLRKIGDRYKLYQGNQDPVMWINYDTYKHILDTCIEKKGKFLISPKLVLQLHGNDWRKKEYKKIRNENR